MVIHRISQLSKLIALSFLALSINFVADSKIKIQNDYLYYRSMIIKTFFCLTLIMVSKIHSQNSIKIDTLKTVEVDTFPLSEKRYIQYVEYQDGRVSFNSILSRSFSYSTLDNKNHLLIVQKYQDKNGVNTDSSFVNPKNLKLLEYRTNITSENLKEIVKVSSNNIVTRIHDNDSIYIFSRPNEALYSNVIISDIIGQIKLKLGKKYVIPTFTPGKRFKKINVMIEVVSHDNLTIFPNQEIKCWKLNVNYGNSNNKSTEWYSVKNQELIKSVLDFGQGNRFVRSIIAN